MQIIAGEYVTFFLFLYKLDYWLLSDLNIFTLRIIPLIFGILSIYLLKDILLYFVDSKIATFTIVTALSHCPIYLFSICEARPLLTIPISNSSSIKYTLKQNTDVLSIRLIILNFLIPSTFILVGYTVYSSASLI